jgi:hypothetical protein
VNVPAPLVEVAPPPPAYTPPPPPPTPTYVAPQVSLSTYSCGSVTPNGAFVVHRGQASVSISGGNYRGPSSAGGFSALGQGLPGEPVTMSFTAVVEVFDPATGESHVLRYTGSFTC